jgi:hypothetical protein
MHATVVSDAHGSLPCHGAEMAQHAAGDDAACVVRAACGHDGGALTGSVVHALLPDVQPVQSPLPSAEMARAPSPAPAAPPREPLIAPPRALVA